MQDVSGEIFVCERFVPDKRAMITVLRWLVSHKTNATRMDIIRCLLRYVTSH